MEVQQNILGGRRDSRIAGPPDTTADHASLYVVVFVLVGESSFLASARIVFNKPLAGAMK